MNRPAALRFLDDVLEPQSSRYRRAPFLKGPFDAAEWPCDFGINGSFTLNFNITLPSGSPLVRRSSLLLLFRLWITSSIQREGAGGIGLALSTQYAIVGAVTSWIDYLLLNAKKYSIESVGLRALSGDTLRGILDKISAHDHRHEAVYGWSARLSEFLSAEIEKSDKNRLENTLQKNPELLHITDEQIDESELSIPIAKIPLARAWLLLNGHYRPNEKLGFRFALNTGRISERLYQNTLRGVGATKRVPAILCAGAYRALRREYPMMPTSSKGGTSGESGSKNEFRRAVAGLESLRCVDSLKRLLPSPEAISKLNRVVIETRVGRFRTVPSSVVFDALKNAIEFHLSYGREILSSYFNVATLAQSRNVRIDELDEKEFIRALTPKTREMGVRRWRIFAAKRSQVSGDKHGVLSENQFHVRIRRNESLFDLMRVYYGAAELTVGTLMARRQRELLELGAGRVLDRTATYLVFEKAKSSRHMRGFRQREARPIPKIAASMIREIERLQVRLVAAGLLPRLSSLFRQIGYSDQLAPSRNSHHAFNDALNAFCDYFETPTVNGRRYYLRQHQCRRFFCMLFFWGNSFGGLDTLRWFIGQTDPEHLYRYITEIIPGAILRGAKAQYAAENLDCYEDLSALLMRRYRISNFTLLDTDELTNYIAQLEADGTVQIEPEFFDVGGRKLYRIIVIVRRKVSS